MRHYFLPKQIKKGDRIIIWGGGYMGKQYLALALKSQISVVKLVDCEADLVPKMNHILSPELPESIKLLSQDDYDYVLIGVAQPKVQEEIKKILTEWGVDKNIILTDVDYWDDISTLDNPEARANCMPHFSWHGEDVIISNIFHRLNITNPSYLDIGCNDPYLGSNTAYFYLTGSKGVCVDANPEMIEKMKIKRPDDISVCMGIVPKEESEYSTFFVLKEDGLSTFDEQYAKEYYENHSMEYDERVCKKIEVQTHSLLYILQHYCHGEWFDYLDIDIEGLDDMVIQNTYFNGKGPKIISIESHIEETRNHLRNEGYFLYTYTVCNDIFVKNEFRSKIVME